MEMSKRTAVAISSVMFAGAAALTVSAAVPAGATAKTTVAKGHHDNYKPRKHGDNGGGGGGGGGTNFYNPNQNYNPVKHVEED